MKSVSVSMDAHLDGVVTSLCTCWKITRADGEVLGFTDHDAPLTIFGVEYKASSGYYRTAISNSADSSVDNLDVSGFLDDDSLSETELRNGAYDYAQVEIFAVNWQDVTEGIIRLRFGYFGEAMIVSSGFFKIELRGLTQLFSQTISETYSPECRADLGDDRCKVPLVPPTRRSGASIVEGTRVVVPQAPGANINIPVLNGGFEYVRSTESQTYWTGTNFLIWNGLPSDDFNENDDFHVTPITTAAGSMSYRRLRSQVGILPDTLSFEVLTEALDITSTPRVKLRMYWASNTGVSAGGIYDVETAYYNLPVGAGSIEIPALGFPDAPVSTSAGFYFYYQLTWDGMPTNGDTVPNIKLYPYPKIADVVPPTSRLSPTGLPLSNAYGWTFVTSAQVAGPNVWMSPLTGDRMLELYPGASAVASAYQDFEFTAEMAEFYPLIDDDVTPMKIKLECAHGAETVSVANYGRYRFYNEAGAQIGVVEQEPQRLYGRGFWGDFTFIADVPPLTRKVRLELNTQNTSINARARAVWDNVSLRMYEESYENQDSYLAYGKVEFVCTTEGTTDPSIPTFDYTLGAVTVDGTAQWTAVTPLHMFTVEITEVTNNKQFKVATLDKPDDWFEWGVIEILEGLNIKKKVEVAKWDNVTKQITLALPLPYTPIVGQALRIHTGCAKSRAVCNTKFNNMVNYRGEPDLPGTDQYFKIGGANTGGSAPPGKG